MFEVNNDLSIHITRGDIGLLSVTADSGNAAYVFAKGDIVRFKVYEKKGCDCVVLMKDFTVEEETEKVDIVLTGDDTRIGELIHKPKDYWYEVELNPDTNPQTIIGYDDNGAKVFRLYPEGKTIEDIGEDEVPFVDELREEMEGLKKDTEDAAQRAEDAAERAEQSSGADEELVQDVEKLKTEVAELQEIGNAIQEIVLAEGEIKGLWTLPAYSIATGEFAVSESNGTVNETIILKKAYVICNGASLIQIFTRDGNYRQMKFEIGASELGGRWTSIKSDFTIPLADLKKLNDIGKEPVYELITRKTFEEINLLGGRVPDGKSDAWREQTITFDKKYKAVFTIIFFDTQVWDKSATRDCVTVWHGDQGRICPFGLPKVMTNTAQRYTRATLERRNGLWWGEYTEPATRSGTTTLKTAQSGYGFSAERIDAAEGIVDDTHLGENENIIALTFQTTLPTNESSNRDNPVGAIAIFGIPIS